MQSITIIVDRFFGFMQKNASKDEYTRYLSWRWCHDAFVDKHRQYQNTSNDNEKREIEDYLALHLGFYLASWGMYRGSSFLLQRDYKTHVKAVREILNKKYDYLWNMNPLDNNFNTQTASQLLFGNPDCIYWFLKNNAYGTVATDTLVTKILLGTFGCLPAFDRYLKMGIRHHNKCSFSDSRLSPNIESKGAFDKLSDFVDKNSTELGALARKYDYPVMKIVDLYFWLIGYEKDVLDSLNSNDVSKAIKNAVNIGICGAAATSAKLNTIITDDLF